jgi:hypothetical protein
MCFGETTTLKFGFFKNAGGGKRQAFMYTVHGHFLVLQKNIFLIKSKSPISLTKVISESLAEHDLAVYNDVKYFINMNLIFKENFTVVFL